MTPHRFRIVVALDRSEYAEIVLEHALDQAARHSGPDLHFVTIVDKPAELEDAKSRLAIEAFEGLEVFGRGQPDWRARLHVRAGKADEEIANLAAEVEADLLVIGRFGPHATDRLLARAPCPTLVVGLTGRSVEPHAQCGKCVAVRADSAGERWFCAEHTSDRGRLTELLPLSHSSIHGGPLL
jgi:nucleotide-binding universal stress UspA family protein